MLAGPLLDYLGTQALVLWQGALRAWQQFHLSPFIFVTNTFPWEIISTLLLLTKTRLIINPQ